MTYIIEGNVINSIYYMATVAHNDMLMLPCALLAVKQYVLLFSPLLNPHSNESSNIWWMLFLKRMRSLAYNNNPMRNTTDVSVVEVTVIVNSYVYKRKCLFY